ncbi:MAG: hypothetical protein ACRD0D_00990 [Acidimicrobiales bacterium]
MTRQRTSTPSSVGLLPAGAREAAWHGRHPDPLRLPCAHHGARGGASSRCRRCLVLERIDDPLVAPLAEGCPVLGWEGDRRLCLYADRLRSRWALMRLEADGRYRISRVTGMAAVGGVDLVGALLLWLVAHDRRRGYDPMAEVAAAEAAVERAGDAELDDWALNEGSPRLRRALEADGVSTGGPVHAAGYTPPA